MDKVICLNCGGMFGYGAPVQGCCSVRCALECGRLEECPECANHGFTEVLCGPEVVDETPCSEGCCERDPWVASEAPTVDLGNRQNLDFSEVPF